jgi:hypothetical protein
MTENERVLNCYACRHKGKSLVVIDKDFNEIKCQECKTGRVQIIIVENNEVRCLCHWCQPTPCQSNPVAIRVIENKKEEE